MNTFKIYFSNDNIRRIRVSTPPSYRDFISVLSDLYPNFHPELTIKYMDEDGDKISLDTQFEWDQMNLEMEGQKTVRLWVEEHSTGYFKDSVAPEVVKCYVDQKSKEAVDIADGFMTQLKENVPDCLASIFDGGKIIPSQIPEFLKGAISLNYIEENVVDLDVDVPELFDLLHARALSLLDSVDTRDLEKGRDYLMATLKLVPDHALALYNLACAESLLGHTQNALHYLDQAVNNGFRDIEHIISDADLANIRHTEEFKSLIEILSNQFTPTYESDIKITVLEPEEQIEITIPEKQVDLSESVAPLRVEYGEELTLLQDMGFSADNDVLLLLLDQFTGDVEQVMSFLVEYQ